MDINNEPMINEEINDREVRLIGKEGEQLGVMSLQQAMASAAAELEARSCDLARLWRLASRSSGH